MRWQRLLGSAAVAVGVAAAPGCGTAPPVRAAVGEMPAPTLVVGAAEEPAVRLQKPEGESSRVVTASSPVPPAPGEVVVSVRATVNGQAILDSEVRDAALGQMSGLLRVAASDRAREEQKILDGALDAIIDRELLYQDAVNKLRRAGKKDIFDKVKESADKEFQRWVRSVKSQFHGDDEFKQYLQAMGTSLESQRRLRERMYVAEEYLRSNVLRFVDRATGPQDVLDYYRTHPEEFTRADKLEWQDIFLLASRFPTRDEARRFAESLAVRARDGEDFVALGRQYDDGLAKDQQGLGLGSERGKVKPPEAEEILFKLRAGEVGPVIELRDGFHVVKVLRRDYAGAMPYDEKVQLAVKEKIRNDVYQKERKRFLDELRKSAQIEKMK